MRRRPRRRRFRRFSGSRRPSGSRCCGTWPPSHSCLRPSIGREVQNCAWLSSRFAGLHWRRGGFLPVRRKRSMKDRSRQTPGRRQQGSLLIYRLHRRQYMVPSIIGTPLDLRVEALVERGRGPRAAWWRGMPRNRPRLGSYLQSDSHEASVVQKKSRRSARQAYLTTSQNNPQTATKPRAKTRVRM